MTKLEFEGQIHAALKMLYRQWILGGILVSVALLIPLVGLFWLLDSNPSRLPVFFAIALPLDTAILVWWAYFVRSSFRKNSVECASCNRYVGLLQWRTVLASGRCENCNAHMFDV